MIIIERNVFRKYQIEHLCGFHEYLTNTASDELLELFEKYSLNEERSFELIFYLSEELDSEEEISELFKKFFMQIYKEHVLKNNDLKDKNYYNLLEDLESYVNNEEYVKFSNQEFPQSIEEVVEVEVSYWIKNILK